MADSTGQPLDKIEEDTDRDFFMTPEEAMEYGIIDEVRTPSSFGASFGPCVAPVGTAWHRVADADCKPA